MKIEIETGNAAFDDGNHAEECKRIIAQAIQNLPTDGPDEDEKPERYPLRDINGNKVGFIEW